MQVLKPLFVRPDRPKHLSFVILPRPTKFLMKLGSCIHSCTCANIALRRDLFFLIQSIWKRWLYKPSEWGIEDKLLVAGIRHFQTPEKNSFWKHKPRWYRIWTAISNSNAIRICKLLPEHSAWHEQTTRNIALDEAGCQWSRWAAFLFCSFKPLLEKPLWHDILTFGTFASGTRVSTFWVVKGSETDVFPQTVNCWGS